MTSKELDAIRKRLDKAKPGPWKWQYGQLISLTKDPQGFTGARVVMNEPGINKPNVPDARFIENAATDIAALLAEVRFLSEREQECYAFREEIAKLKQSAARGGRIFTKGELGK